MNAEMLGSPRRASALAIVVCLVGCCALGCSALVNPDSDLLGSDPGVDAGRVVLMDAGVVRRDGAAVRPDATTMMCAEGATRCEGDTLLTCVDSMELPQDCQALDAFCDGARCTPHVCTPNQRECSSGGTAVVACSPRGHEVSRTACPNGCDSALARCRADGPACEEGIDEIEIGGSRTVDLCDETDDNSNQMAEGCNSSMRAAVADRVFSLTLDRMQRVTIELTDVDSARAIDTLFYVRQTCDDMGSQVACGDDVPCDESTAEPRACFGEVDLRQSRTTVTLAAGTYYIVVDGFEYSTERVSFGCGRVELHVGRDSIFPFP